jgi:hypothetical protein
MYSQVETSSDPYDLINKNPNKCSGSVTFWDESGSLDPYTGLRIRIWIQILLFLSVTFEMPTKIKFLWRIVFSY